MTRQPIVCTECGNDEAVEGHPYCLDCLEANPTILDELDDTPHIRDIIRSLATSQALRLLVWLLRRPDR